jgi:hypothetical protein
VIGGDLVGGNASGKAELIESGFIRAKRIASLTLGGSLIGGRDDTTGQFNNNGAVRADEDIGTILIKGNIAGNETKRAVITAVGQAIPTATTDVAIGRVTVRGRVEFGLIDAGLAPDRTARNADAQIGPVVVGGDWVASSLVAGSLPGATGLVGDSDDVKMSGAGVKDEPAVFSKVTSWTVGGQVLGTVGAGDHFGVVAEEVGVVSVGGTPIPMTAGAGNDDILLGITGDFRVNEG